MAFEARRWSCLSRHCFFHIPHPWLEPDNQIWETPRSKLMELGMDEEQCSPYQWQDLQWALLVLFPRSTWALPECREERASLGGFQGSGCGAADLVS